LTPALNRNPECSILQAHYFFGIILAKMSALGTSYLADLIPGQFPQLLLDHLEAAIYTCDADGYIIHYNKAAVSLWGSAPEPGKDRWCGSWKMYEPDGITPIPPAECPVAIALKQGRPVSSRPIIIEKPGGERNQVIPYPRLFFDDQGQVIGAVDLLLDVSLTISPLHDHRENNAGDSEAKYRLAALDLRKMNEQLRRSNHDLEQFAYIASHDLQEPLRKIQSFIDIARQKEDKKNLPHYFDKIVQSAKRMSTLIKDVLNYSRLDSDETLFTEVSLNQVLKEVANDYEHLILDRRALIKSTDLPVVNGIHTQLRQLFANLLSNSLKFSVTSPEISIAGRPLPLNQLKDYPAAEQGKSYVELTFSDNGIGFDPQYADRIFMIFQRLHNLTEYSGTGIGLALCKKIVENHQGYIKAESAPGQGSVFTILLPA
jgi:signal transduction histidine kinase